MRQRWRGLLHAPLRVRVPTMKKSVISCIVLIVFFLESCATTNSNMVKYLMFSNQESVEDGTIVNCEQGLLQGSREGATIAWKGVRYAAAPVGELRWREPQAAPSWPGVRSARAPGKPAPQLIPVTNSPTGDEDCLTLNIWRPDDLADDMPVYIWVHGGANTAGDASPNGDYSGRNLAERSHMVVISINYRLGPFGWLLDSDLVPESTGGNLGLLDIVAALRWIKSNARAFGGNPANLTLTGESAGAANILALLCMDEATGLFQRAILQSPLDLTSTANAAREESRKLLCRVMIGANLAETPDEASILLDSMSPKEKSDFFRSRKTEEFLEDFSGGALAMYDWPSLILDGTVLPREGLTVFRNGGHKVKVPLIIGSNKDEVGVFLFLEGKISANSPLYQKALAYGSEAWRAKWIESIASDLASDPEQGPVFMYRFDWGSSQPDGNSVLPVTLGTNVGAFHALEIPFFLGNDTIAGYVISRLIFNLWNSESRKSLTAAIMSYTRGFALGIDLENFAPVADLERSRELRLKNDLPPWPRFRPLNTDNRSALGLIFSADTETASVTLLSSSPSAGEELAALEARIPANEIRYIKSKLPLFMKNAWQNTVQTPRD